MRYILTIPLLTMCCVKPPAEKGTCVDHIFGEYKEGVRMGRMMVNSKRLPSDIKDIIAKDSLRIYNIYK